MGDVKTGWANPFNKKGSKMKGFGQKAFGGRKGTPAPFKAAEVRAPDLESEEFETLLYRLRDPAKAKRVQQLKGQYPNGTLPELVTLDYLNRKQINNIYQAKFGRSSLTGMRARPDFVIIKPGGQGDVWEINGDHWHSKYKTPETDARRARGFLNKTYDGVKITGYVELWESRILAEGDGLFDKAMVGIGLGKL